MEPARNQTILVSAVPTVSWLLCSHVANDHLKLAITSCLTQSFGDFEMVFIANGDMAEEVADNVRDWFGADHRIRIFTTPVRHLSFSLTFGLHHARGSLIARMDSDDISRFDRLQRQVQFMTEHENVAIVGTNYEIINKDGCVLNIVNMPSTNESIRNALFHKNPLCHPTVMFRRKVVLDVGGYLGGLHAEDYDLWARLSLSPKVRFANIPYVGLGYRVIGVGMARRSRWAYASMAASQFRNFLVGGGLRWCFASFFSVIKLLIRSSPVIDT